MPSQIVDMQRLTAERFEQQGFNLITRSQTFSRRARLRAFVNDIQLIQNIIHTMSEFCPFLDQRMCAFASRLMDAARNGEYFAPLFSGMAGSDQRAAAERCFNDQNAERDPAQQAVAAGEVFRFWTGTHREF